jgi:hypothetical protein
LPRPDRPAGSSIENHHITMKTTPVMLSMGHGWVGPPLSAFYVRLALSRQAARVSVPVFLMRQAAHPAA